MAGKEKNRQKRGCSPIAAVCCVLSAAGALLYLLAAEVPGFADGYAAVMNPFMVNTQGRLNGLFPFSLGELLVCCGAAAAAVWTGRLLLLAFRREKGPASVRNFFLRTVRALLCAAAILFFLFEVNEGVYFYRTSFADAYGLRNGGYSTDELENTCIRLAEEIGRYAGEVSRDENGYMVPDGNLNRRVGAAMESLGEIYPYLSGYYPRVKPVFFSAALDYMQFTGIYSIYTLEANYNCSMPAYNIPFTMAHELSHLKGIMNEKEANFIAYISCMSSDDPDIRYSGAMLAWTYCGNELYRRDYDRWLEIASGIDERAEADIRYNRIYWDSYEGTVAETTDTVNDAYLKKMGVEEGTASYDLVVDLIVTYETDRQNSAQVFEP